MIRELAESVTAEEKAVPSRDNCGNRLRCGGTYPQPLWILTLP